MAKNKRPKDLGTQIWTRSERTAFILIGIAVLLMALLAVALVVVYTTAN